jgi:DNA replication factor GINS
MYDEIYEAWRKERESMELQVLSNEFYERLVGYVRQLKQEGRMLDKESVKAKLLGSELTNVEKMITELVHARLRKVLDKLRNGERVSETALAAEERRLCGDVLSLPESFGAFLSGILQGRLINIEESAPRFRVVRFLSEIPAFVGVDMKTYGPFKTGDVASLPAENAKGLMDRDVVASVEVESTI